MKTIKLLGWAFIALFMCANLIACSSSDDEAIITNQKKLVELELAQSIGYMYDLNLKLSYNTKGLLESVIDEEEGYFNASFTWFDDNIESIHQDYYKTKDKYYLTNGLITKQIMTSTEGRKTYIYKYNDSKQFIEMECTNNNYNQFLTYENNKLVEYNDRFHSSKFTYGQQTCKGYFPWEIVIKVFCNDDIEIINVAHPELFNMRTNQLPTAIETKYGDKYELDYDFDEDGYISQIFCEAGNFFIRLKWE